MLKKLVGFISLPSPVDVNWSAGQDPAKTVAESLQDWEYYLQDNYPVRYALTATFYALTRKGRQLSEDALYWLKCHTLKSHKWHLIDLRGVDPTTSYRWGYMDPNDQLELAAWACLLAYVEKHDPQDPYGAMLGDDLTLEDLTEEEKSALERHYHDYHEVMTLYHWWKVERPELYQKWLDVAKKEMPLDFEGDLTPSAKLYEEFHRRETEMFDRLMRVRHTLWS